ncbi:hypothetical protein BH09GEM1_BH09GEM1_07260 [soil metagenome]
MALPITQQNVIRFLLTAGEATLHALAWHIRVYRGRGADEVYRAVVKLEEDGFVETEELVEAPNRRGGRRHTVALTRKGMLLFDAPESHEKAFRTCFELPRADRAMKRQAAMFMVDYPAAGWRTASGDDLWAALRAELQKAVPPASVPTQHADTYRSLLRRPAAEVGTWGTVSSSGHVRLVLRAATLGALRAKLRRLDTALLASVSALMPIEILVLGPTEKIDATMVKLVRRWAAPPPRRPFRKAPDAIDHSVRTGSRAAVRTIVGTHGRYEDLPHPKTGRSLPVSELVEARRKHATDWSWSVAVWKSVNAPRMKGRPLSGPLGAVQRV